MKKKHNHIFNTAQKITLSSDERALLREQLHSYMEYHPLSTAASAPVSHGRGGRVRRVLSPVFVSLRRTRLISAAAVVLLAVVTPVAAERALPGDLLYPVKVNFNEEVRAQLAFSPYDRVAWEAERVGRRIEEARTLAEEGKFTDESEAVLAATVREHAQEAKEQLSELRETDAEGAALAEVTFESALDVQSAMLKSEAAASSTVAARTGAAEELANIVEDTRDDVSAQGAGEPLSATRLVEQVDADIVRAEALLEGVSPHLNEEEKAAVGARLDVLVARRDDILGDEEASPEAAAQLRALLSDVQKLITFIGSSDVRARISLAELVPEQPSAEATRARLEATLIILTQKRALLQHAAQLFADDEAAAFEATLGELDELLAEAEESLNTDDLASADEVLTAAEALVTELEAQTAALTEAGEQKDTIGTTTPDDAE